jgi:hypothetical protein
MKREKFVAVYQAHFGDFPSKNGEEAQYWFGMIDALPEGLCQRLFEMVEESLGESNARGKPRMREFGRAWRLLRPPDAAGSQKSKVQGCALCGFTGYMSVPAALKRDATGDRWVFAGDKDVTLELYAYPCRCALGKAHERFAGLNMSVIDEARAYLLDYRQAAGHTTESVEINRADFLACAERSGCSPVGIMRDVLVRSHIERGELDTTPGRGEDKRSCLERVQYILDHRTGTTITALKKYAAEKAKGLVRMTAAIPTIDDEAAPAAAAPSEAPTAFESSPPPKPWVHAGSETDEVIAGCIVDEHLQAADRSVGAAGGDAVGDAAEVGGEFDTSFAFGENEPAAPAGMPSGMPAAEEVDWKKDALPF